MTAIDTERIRAPTKRKDKPAEPLKFPMARAVLVSTNRKIGDKTGRNGPPASATYLSQVSCPQDCAFLNKGCYAEYSFVGVTTRRLKAESEGHTALEAAYAESDAIDDLPALYDLRVHVVGDCATPAVALITSAALERWAVRALSAGRRIKRWAYTHAWRTVPRWCWRSVSILASCETIKQARQAMQRGYAAVVVVEKHPEDGKAYYDNDVKVIPCPQETRGLTCTACRLCFNDQALLARKAVIAFEAHSTGKNKALAQINDRLQRGE